jgi:MFS transporter, FHS family, L-fucose permease
MALAPTSAEATRNPAPNNPATADLRLYIFGLFFIFGGITSLNDVLIPKLKPLFDLSYFEVMLVQFAFFGAYFVVSMPGAALVKRLGYMRTAAVGLLVMTAGCLLFIPAAAAAQFGWFLAALFTLAAGITIVQVVANPLISMLGAASTAHSRLTFAQGFNSLGTTIFPYVGAIVILGGLASVDDSTLTGATLQAFRAKESQVIANAYFGIAVALAIIAALVFLGRNRLREEKPPATDFLQSFDLLRQPRFAFGTLGIFVYVGAEVSIGSILANFLMQADTLALAAQQAGQMVALYWGGAMIGRFVGAAVLRRHDPARVLLAVAIGAGALLMLAGATVGTVAGVALIAVGLMNAIMFPTIFSLACEGLGVRAADGSGIICMAIVGGAIVPLVTGLVADAATLRAALVVPLVCYAVIALFAATCRKPPEVAATAA